MIHHWLLPMERSDRPDLPVGLLPRRRMPVPGGVSVLPSRVPVPQNADGLFLKALAVPLFWVPLPGRMY